MSGRGGEMVPNTVLMQESVHLVEVDDIWKSFGEVAALRGRIDVGQSRGVDCHRRRQRCG